MGAEYLFSSTTMLGFLLINVGIVVWERHFFRRGFFFLGIKKISLGYTSLLILNLLFWGGVSDGNMLKFLSNFVLSCYVTFLYCSLFLLPFSLFIMQRGNFSISKIIVFSLSISLLLSTTMFFSAGLSDVLERGIYSWVLAQIYVGGFLLIEAMVFFFALKFGDRLFLSN